MQKYNRIPYDYINEYQRLILDYYSRHGVPFLITYYNLNTSETVWDNEYLDGGSYERTGTYSGISRNKFLYLPVFFLTEMTTNFDGQETGYIKENESDIVIPGSYNIVPYPGDVLKFTQDYLMPSDNTYPIYMVSGVEISPNTYRRFWKCHVKVYQSKSESVFDDQVEDTFVFFEYDKKIHTLSRSLEMTRLMSRMETCRENLSDLYDNNSGYYFL